MEISSCGRSARWTAIVEGYLIRLGMTYKGWDARSGAEMTLRRLNMQIGVFMGYVHENPYLRFFCCI